jgi:FkbM family methyltransferase
MKSIIRKLSQSSEASSGQPDPYLELKRLTRDIAEPIIFDVGAHRGYITAKFRSLIPSCTIHAFEPFPESFERLAERSQSDPRVSCHRFGLADHNGEIALNANASAATNSILETDTAAGETWGSGLLDTQTTVRVEVKTLDSVVESLGVSRIDILKLDVQGAEPLVMAGAAELCRAGRIGCIYTEVITQPTYKGQKRFDHALAEFYDRGFDLHNIYNLNSTESGTLRQVDAIFVRAR